MLTLTVQEATMRYPNIGVVNPNHAAFRVRRGQMQIALDFFRNILHWYVSRRRPKGNWGEAKFVFPDDGSLWAVQLTDEYSHSARPTTYSASHLALEVDSPKQAAEDIKEWALGMGYSCKIEPADRKKTKWFVQLSSFLTFELELVPH